ncbi:dcp-66 [Pristionchus pacificus]|uniref:Dcp-66 n=1 Tax=Pristionchus pacificus TaxID=54126 RepID=A0A2A6BKC8_PRIPA|nr:dcp-66 [Pristionchus pacificus]|eukprot:PDM66359.1 dcp-66 [Pristionchus pacificus]
MENGLAMASLNGGGAPPMMMDTDEEMNGLDLSTKSSSSGNNGAAPAAPAAPVMNAGPMTLTLNTNGGGSNGSTDGGTPTPGTPLNGSSPDKAMLEAGQISPSSLRRSTRASAIKAQQKIKDGDVPQSMEADNSVESEDDSMAGDDRVEKKVGCRALFGPTSDGPDGESAAKKRKLENGKALDQFSHEFSIKLEDDGGVYMLDEGSELSSLNETEIETLKKCYDKLLARELTTEQKEERTRMIKQAEADLRNEEAKLTMLKKMRASQIPKHNPVSDLQRKLAANVAANSAGAAYKPPVAGTAAAVAAAAKTSAMAGQMAALQQMLAGKGGAQAQAQLMALLTSNASALMPNMTPQQKEVRGEKREIGVARADLCTSTPSASTAAASSANAAATAAVTNSGATTAQKLAAARHAFRKTADGQLITQTAMPKACPNELFFIPNPNAPDFLYMLGLDQVVGRVLKDKNAIRSCSERPYECEECGSDFATGWKCIEGVAAVCKTHIAGTKEEDLHLYCEGCLRQAQKKKLRHDRNSQLKKIYSKVAMQEKEFEKQISDGKLDGMLATVFAQLQAQNPAAVAAASAARPTAAASPAVQNLSTKPATPSVPSPAMQKPATPLQSTPSGSKTSSSSAAASSSTSSGTKRPATSASNNSQQLQNQLAQLAQLARSNPMMAAAMMSGGLMGGQAQAQAQAAAAAAAMAQSYGPMLQQMQQMQQLQQRMQQQQQQASNSNANAAKASSSSSSAAAAAGASNSNNNSVAAAQASMAMMLQQAMQNARSGAGGAASQNAANANAMATMAQLAALSQAGALSGAQGAFSNPTQLLRQMQQLAAAQMQKKK